MKNLLLSVLVSCIVAASTVAFLNKYTTASLVDAQNVQSKSYSNTDHEMGKLMKAMAKLPQTQTDIQTHLTKLDLAIQSLESSLQDTSTSLWDEIASIQQTLQLQAENNGTQVALTSGEDTEISENTEQESQAPTPEAHIAEMDTLFYTQEADQSWDDVAREQIYANYMSSQPKGIQLQNLSCSGVLCRLEVLQEPGYDFMEHTFGEEPLVPWNHRARTASIQNSDGSATTVMYISREGYKLPSL
jgi:hypothetical protein